MPWQVKMVTADGAPIDRCFPYARFESHQMIPIPNVGERFYTVDEQQWEVTERVFRYYAIDIDETGVIIELTCRQYP